MFVKVNIGPLFILLQNVDGHWNKAKKLFTVKNNYFHHKMKFTGFRQFAVLPGCGFTPKQHCIVTSYPTGPLDVKPLLLTKGGVLCVRTLCQPTSQCT